MNEQSKMYIGPPQNVLECMVFFFLFEKEEEEYETIDINNVCRIAITYDTQSSIRFKSHLKFFLGC